MVILNEEAEQNLANNVEEPFEVEYGQNINAVAEPGFPNRWGISNLLIIDHSTERGKPEYLMRINQTVEWYDYFDAIEISLEAVTEHNERNADIGDFVRSYLANFSRSSN